MVRSGQYRVKQYPCRNKDGRRWVRMYRLDGYPAANHIYNMKYVGRVSRHYILWCCIPGSEKRKPAQKTGDDISRMRTHRCRPTIRIFFAKCKNMSGWAGKICGFLPIFQQPIARLSTMADTDRILMASINIKINLSI